MMGRDILIIRFCSGFIILSVLALKTTLADLKQITVTYHSLFQYDYRYKSMGFSYGYITSKISITVKRKKLSLFI